MFFNCFIIVSCLSTVYTQRPCGSEADCLNDIYAMLSGFEDIRPRSFSNYSKDTKDSVFELFQSIRIKEEFSSQQQLLLILQSLHNDDDSLFREVYCSCVIEPKEFKHPEPWYRLLDVYLYEKEVRDLWIFNECNNEATQPIKIPESNNFGIACDVGRFCEPCTRGKVYGGDGFVLSNLICHGKPANEYMCCDTFIQDEMLACYSDKEARGLTIVRGQRMSHPMD